MFTVDGQSIKSHKFVLKARSNDWGVDLDSVSEIAMPVGKFGDTLAEWCNQVIMLSNIFA